uniref:Alpha-type protein kinase domain-containing protein n=1 Tax=Alexandrium monilatum TaxID=311494 RepID=A0A7S4UNS1_9DINO
MRDDGDRYDQDGFVDGWTTVAARPRQTKHPHGPVGGPTLSQSSASSYPSVASSRQPRSPKSNASAPTGKGGTRGGHVGHFDRTMAARRVFVQGLTLSTSDGLLRSAFRHCGRIDDARVVRLPDGTSRGFGFVLFADEGAAAMAAREGGVRIDGKLCRAELAKPREDGDHRRGSRSDDVSLGDIRHEIRDFITRHEVSGTARIALSRADPKAALRVVRAIESCQMGFSEGLIHSELQKVACAQLSHEMESRVWDWVAETGLSAEWQDRVRSVLLAQRPEEIEHVLEIGQSRQFLRDLCSKDSPTMWLLGQVQRFRRRRTLNDIQAFCERFNFDKNTELSLGELSAERARRLMQSWRPAAPGTQKERQQEFLLLLHQALKERRSFREERTRKSVSAVASHSRIIEEWSDGDDDADSVEQWSPRGRMGNRSEADGLYTFDAGAIDGHTERPSASSRGKSGIGPEQFVIHSQGSNAYGTTGTMHSRSSGGMKPKHQQPKPTHFVLCVDTSGSMVTADCRSLNGRHTSRLDAVLETCSAFVTSSALNRDDVYSFVSFNEESALHFSCLQALDAVAKLDTLRPKAEKQTFYSMGIRGIEAAIRRDPRRHPAHVVFLSDGEPTDPSTYIHDLQVLRRKHPGDALKIYTVGFGESAKVNEREDDFQFLQQLASLGRGHFQRCGASLSSLQGAFTAVTSTITRTRSSVGRRSSIGRWTLEDEISHLGAGASAADTDCYHGTIDEVGSSEDDDDAWPMNVPPWPGFAERPTNAVEFELPHPRSIFKDLRNPDLWKDFMAAQTSFRFDGRTFNRTAAVQRVFLRRKPFMQGGMRLVYGMVLESGVHSPDAMEHMMCAKRLFQDLEKDRGFQAHVAFCKSTAVAQFYARQFRALTEKVSARVQFGFLDCQLYSPVGEGEDGYHFCGEAWLKGHFVKLNSNAGFVNETDYSEHSEIAQAFSHFTFDRSRGELLVVDLQGICGGDSGNPYFLLTDPQVHSRGAFERFGAGDLGERGISAFFQKHRCGELCRLLNLRKEYDLRAPTHTLHMPGVQDCIRHMLGDDGKEFFQQLREECRLSSLALPRGAHSEWLDIRMWATQRGGMKAEVLLQRRLQAYYDRTREVVPAEPRPRWDATRWRTQLDAWRCESGASIVAYPSNWQEGPNVQELWVFSEFANGRYLHENRAMVCQRIREALEEEAEAAGGNESLQANASTAEKVWRQYQDTNRVKYWYREPDGLWFWEHDPQWQRFLDEASDRHWWWNMETGLWFYETQR